MLRQWSQKNEKLVILECFYSWLCFFGFFKKRKERELPVFSVWEKHRERERERERDAHLKWKTMLGLRKRESSRDHKHAYPDGLICSVDNKLLFKQRRVASGKGKQWQKII